MRIVVVVGMPLRSLVLDDDDNEDDNSTLIVALHPYPMIHVAGIRVSSRTKKTSTKPNTSSLLSKASRTLPPQTRAS